MTLDTRPPERPDLPETVTMPLLDRLVADSLDQDYRTAADRRGAGGAQPGRRRFGRGTAAAVAVFGLLIAVAAVQTWRDAPSSADDRAAIVEQIRRENAAAAEQQRTLRQLKQGNANRQTGLQTLGRTTAAAETRARRLAVRTGYAVATGEGVRAVADDARDEDAPDGQVRDEDLAMLVDGLWGAGARAIAINGIRLTALSPIRTSGVAIHVAFRPISPPYTVVALGDTATLQSRFADTTHGLAWLSLVRAFGFRFTMQNVDELRLPAASGPVLRNVRPADEDARPRQEDSP